MSRREQGTPVGNEPSNSSSDDTLVRRRSREHSGHKLPTTNEHHDGVMGLGGARGPPESGEKDNTGKSTKPTAQDRGSSTTERRMEDYFTRTPPETEESKM
jgi:hypothetical protein